MQTPFHEILRIMRTSNADSFPVLNEKEEYVGMIDLRRISTVLHNKEMQKLLLAEDLVLTDQYTLTLNQDLLEVYNEMSVEEHECLPVVDENDDKKLIGIVTRFHVMYRYNKELVLSRGDRAEK